MIERPLKVVQGVRIHGAAEERGKLQADECLAGALALSDHVQVRLGSDKHRAGLP